MKRKEEVMSRLSSLMEMLSQTLEQGSREKAEIIAIATGLGMVWDEFDDIFTNAFYRTMSRKSLLEHCDFFDVSKRLTTSGMRSQIGKKLSANWNDYETGELENYIKSASENLSVYTSKYEMVFRGINIVNIRYLKNISQALDYYLPPCTVPVLAGDGMTFDQWEAIDYDFESFDRLNTQFSMLDTIYA